MPTDAPLRLFVARDGSSLGLLENSRYQGKPSAGWRLRKGQPPESGDADLPINIAKLFHLFDPGAYRQAAR